MINLYDTMMLYKMLKQVHAAANPGLSEDLNLLNYSAPQKHHH